MNNESKNALVIYGPSIETKRHTRRYSAQIKEFFDTYVTLRRIPYIRHAVVFAIFFTIGSCYCAYDAMPPAAITNCIVHSKLIFILSLIISSFSGFTVFGKSVSYVLHASISLFFGYLIYHLIFIAYQAAPIAIICAILLSAVLAFLFLVHFVEIEYAFKAHLKAISKKYVLIYFLFNLAFIYLIYDFFRPLLIFT